MRRSGLDLLSVKCYEDMELGWETRTSPCWEGGWAGTRDGNVKAGSTEGYAEDSGQGNKMPLLIVIYDHEKTEAETEIHGDQQNA